MGQEYGFNLISDRYGIAEADAEKLFCQCDLMRLPGVKDVRSSLYYDCGYRSLQVFLEQNAKDMQRHIGTPWIFTKKSIDKK